MPVEVGPIGGRTRLAAGLVGGAALAAAAALGWWYLRVEAPAKPHLFTLSNYDAYAYYHPTFEYAFRELRAGRFPFWNPYQHCGSPFFATAQHLLLYPLNVFFLLLPTAAALKATALLHVALGLVFTAGLGRVLGLAWPAAATAAAAFVFSPAIAGLVVVPHHLYGAVWMPLHLALAHLVLTRPRKLGWAALLGTALAAQYLGGYPMFPLFSAYLIGAYALWWAGLMAFAHDGSGVALRRGILALAGAALLAVMLSAPQLWPALELAELSSRRLDALDIELADPHYRRTGALDLILQTILPTRDRPFQFLLMTPTPGWVVLALIAAAPFNRRQRRTAGFCAIFAILTYLLGLGRHTPLFGFYFDLPTGAFFRITSRFFALTALPLAVLAGIGVDALWRAEGRPRVAVAALALLASLAAALTMVLHFGADAIAATGILPNDMVEPGLLSRLRVGRLDLIALTVGLAVYLGTSGRARRLAVAALPVTVYVSLLAGHLNRAVLPEMEPDLLAPPAGAVEFLRAQQSHARTHVPPPALPVAGVRQIPVKLGMLYGIYADTDRENVYPSRFADYTDRLAPADVKAARRAIAGKRPGGRSSPPQGQFVVTPRSPNLVLFDLMGTRYIVAGPKARFGSGADGDRFPLRDQLDGIRIYENPAALPRVFLVPRAEVLPAEAVLDRLTAADFDPRASVVLEERPAIPLDDHPSAAGSARIVAYEPHRVAVEASSPAPALLVLTDQHYPGWEATIDGAPAPIHRADYLFRAVALPAGDHRVEFRFVPRSFHRGLALAVAGVVGLILVAIGAARRRRRVR